VNLEETYKGKSVFVTGHTGFKGSWLTEWLLLLGARVTGYSLVPPTEPALFEQLRLRQRISHFEEDIRNEVRLRDLMLQAKPEFVFHLAAQPLVRLSYRQPRETYEVNVMGTVNVLEGLRSFSHPCASVFITTDKCYAETDPSHSNRETDPLGGHDPYSSSKAAAELAIAAYRSSFFSQEGSKVAVATARAGNVVGGGDWAADRIVPDCIRSLAGGKSIAVRNRTATRPWQHVLDPLSGYLELGAALAGQRQRRGRGKEAAGSSDEEGDFDSAFNFGPEPEGRHSVLELVEEILKHWPGAWHDRIDEDAPHEARHLALATDKAAQLLGWRPTYDFCQAVEKTVEWYRESSSFAAGDSDSFINLTHQQIAEYEARRAGFQRPDRIAPPG
jgi:CDP-glucose 4,6-dehydratase